MKYLFLNDYSEGAHPDLLRAIEKYNVEQEPGYGEDSVSKTASDLIKKFIQNNDSKVYFISGGTQANLTVIGSLLKPHESVIAPSSGHINIHEAGAIETTGHKIEAIPSTDGKLRVKDIQKILTDAMPIHMAKPRAVFISNSTEVGTIYTKSELTEISNFCRNNNLYLYLDGARVGTAIAARGQDLSLSDIAKLTDVFYIGGTKNGAALGEAIVINNKALQEDFEYHLKLRGALLAKGRFIPAQFIALFEGSLYMDLASHANKMAEKLTGGIKQLGFEFLTDSPTNQIFPILPNSIIEKMKELYGFYVWSSVDETTSSIRLVTSWASKEEKIEEFLNDLKVLAGK